MVKSTLIIWMEEVMRLELFIWMALLVGIMTLVPGCKRSQEERAGFKLQERLGTLIVEGIENPDQVTYFQVKPDWNSDQKFEIVSEEKVLPEDMQWLLQETLLDDQSYFFNKTKMCLFVPELGFRFSGKNEILVFLSFSCRQVKFISNGRERILDNDSHYHVFEEHFQELSTHF